MPNSRRRTTTASPPIAHLVGPGKIKSLNGRLAFHSPGLPGLRLDLESLKSICCYGDVSYSGEALERLLAQGVAVAMLTPGGNRCQGRLVGPRDSTAALRFAQARLLLDDARALELAAHWVAGKLASMRVAARHYQRQGVMDLGLLVRTLDQSDESLSNGSTLDILRGVEGNATRQWFSHFGRLLRTPWTFAHRVRRPPTDPVNALLSLGSTWLLQRVRSACEIVGLEPCWGTLHALHPARPSLACDVMEPLRIPFVDRWVVALCNQSHVTPESFLSGTKGVRLVPNQFGAVLVSWEQFAYEGKLDALLGKSIDKLCRFIRNSDIPPDPLDPSKTVGGSGKITNDYER